MHPRFNSINLWNRTITNRLVVAPMFRISASPTGLGTEKMKNYYTSFALGGFAMIITEGLYTDNNHSQAYIHIAVQTGEWERDSFYDNGTSFASLATEIGG